MSEAMGGKGEAASGTAAAGAGRTVDPQALAEAVRDGMFKDDAASRGLGMQIEAVGPGYARIAMTVRAGSGRG